MQNEPIPDDNRYLHSLERIAALTEHITLLGNQIHTLRADNDWLYRELIGSQESVQQIFKSKSWKITKPFRALARFIRHGFFDSHGKVTIRSLPTYLVNHINSYINKTRAN